MKWRLQLQDVTGLSDSDPIHCWLGIVDRFLGEHDWLDTYRKLPKDGLAKGIWLCLGHPVKYPTVEEYCLDNFEEYLQQNGEPVLAEIVSKLRRRKGEDGLDNYGIRCIILWLVANMDYLKETYMEGLAGRHRKITSEWTPSW
jgi:hypothetical protein